MKNKGLVRLQVDLHSGQVERSDISGFAAALILIAGVGKRIFQLRNALCLRGPISVSIVEDGKRNSTPDSVSILLYGGSVL